VTRRILVFEIPAAEHLRTAIEQELELTVATVHGAGLINEAALALKTRAGIQIKVDTGMGRLGLPASDAAGAIRRIAGLPGLDLRGVYSHFATSDDEDQSFAREQLERFLGVCAAVTREGIAIPLRHMANSGAIISLPEAHLDLVRPGIMLYGYPPRQGMSERFPVRPVLSLISRVAMVKEVLAGTSISYGRRYTTAAATVIATIPMGYADGYSRLLTNNAEVLIRGRRYPVVGTICMDQLMVDLGQGSTVEEGDQVTFIGIDGSERITAWDVAARTATIPYEVTCLITQRIPRVFLGPRSP
jgi:alanine racemase